MWLAQQLMLTVRSVASVSPVVLDSALNARMGSISIQLTLSVILVLIVLF